MMIDSSRYEIRSIKRTTFALFVSQPSKEFDHDPLAYDMYDEIEVQTRDPKALKWPHDAVAVGFYDDVELTIAIDGVEYDFDTVDREWEHRANQSPWFFLNAEIVAFDDVPEHLRKGQEPVRRSVFIKTRFGTYCHFWESRNVEVI